MGEAAHPVPPALRGCPSPPACPALPAPPGRPGLPAPPVPPGPPAPPGPPVPRVPPAPPGRLAPLASERPASALVRRVAGREGFVSAYAMFGRGTPIVSRHLEKGTGPCDSFRCCVGPFLGCEGPVKEGYRVRVRVFRLREVPRRLRDEDRAARLLRGMQDLQQPQREGLQEVRCGHRAHGGQEGHTGDTVTRLPGGASRVPLRAALAGSFEFRVGCLRT
jgi:hypothetical protein